jgi:hypothetical protein
MAKNCINMLFYLPLWTKINYISKSPFYGKNSDGSRKTWHPYG